MITGFGAVVNAAQVRPGSIVAVFGAGGVGLNVIQTAALAGAGAIIAVDLKDNKLEYARQFGATHTVNGSQGNAVEQVRLSQPGAAWITPSKSWGFPSRCGRRPPFLSVVDSVSEKQAVYRVQNETINISSDGKEYPAYLATPSQEGEWPAVILIHSFNGLEPGYMTMVDDFASQGYVVIAPQWQTYAKSPKDDVVKQLISDSAIYLKSRKEVNSGSLGLTGFCAGGIYTMLFLPQMADFKSGVAWYGFPYSGGFNNESKPADFIKQLKTPILMIHGTKDEPSPIADIYNFAADLDAAGKYFELKV